MGVCNYIPTAHVGTFLPLFHITDVSCRSSTHILLLSVERKNEKQLDHHWIQVSGPVEFQLFMFDPCDDNWFLLLCPHSPGDSLNFTRSFIKAGVCSWPNCLWSSPASGNLLLRVRGFWSSSIGRSLPFALMQRYIHTALSPHLMATLHICCTCGWR